MRRHEQGCRAMTRAVTRRAVAHDAGPAGAPVTRRSPPTDAAPDILRPRRDVDSPSVSRRVDGRLGARGRGPSAACRRYIDAPHRSVQETDAPSFAGRPPSKRCGPPAEGYPSPRQTRPPNHQGASVACRAQGKSGDGPADGHALPRRAAAGRRDAAGTIPPAHLTKPRGRARSPPSWLALRATRPGSAMPPPTRPPDRGVTGPGTLSGQTSGQPRAQTARDDIRRSRELVG